MSGLLRIRVWVDGELASETWLDVDDPGHPAALNAMMDRQQALVEQAIDAGRPWQVESFDPDLPAHRAYLRIGTDPRGMVAPAEVTSWEQLEADIGRRYRGPGLN